MAIRPLLFGILFIAVFVAIIISIILVDPTQPTRQPDPLAPVTPVPTPTPPVQ
jgi:hypothetical protein